MNNPFHFSIALSCLFLLLPCLGFGQQQQNYTVYKLQHKIGAETSKPSKTGDSLNYLIRIETNDRSAKLSLTSSLKSFQQHLVAYTSIGQTSRAAHEQIDTSFVSTNGYPISDNGSIQLKELLVKYWLAKGKPLEIPSLLTKTPIKIKELAQVNLPNTAQMATVFELQHTSTKNEFLWLSADGKALFLATNDTETDKREVIANDYQQLLDFFTAKSNHYLIEAYQKANKDLGKSFEDMAIVGGNIIDFASGTWINNGLIVLKNGKIVYTGPMDKALIPAQAQQLNASGKYIIPGLWDMHVHLFHPDDLKNALLNGITTIRDMANEFDFVNGLKALTQDPSFPSPTLLRAGVIEGKSPFALGAVQASNSTEISTAVKMYHDAGFDQIKVYSKISKKNVPLIFEQAKKHNMEMVGHIPDALTLKYCVENGMKMISHVHYFMNAMKWKSTDLNKDNQDLLALLQQKGVVVDPTLNVYASGEPYKLANYKRVTKFLFDNGIPIVAGTDNGKIAQELSLYVEAGLTPLAALKAATIVPAKAMKMEHQSGSIEVGKNADLLLLDANPLENIKHIEKINTIIKGTFVIIPLH